MAPTYGMYRVAAATNDVEFVEVQLEEDFSLDPEKMLAAADRHTKAMFVCSPNNPTANSIPRETIEFLLENFDGMVVLDEAYIDFSQRESMVPELAKYPNLIVLQTLSKAWAMAGLRLGLAFASEYVVELFSRVKYPYNINVVTQQMVIDRLAEPVDKAVQQIIAQRGEVVATLSKMPVVKHLYPTDANFVLARFDEPRKVYEKLVEAGVIVRDRSGIRGCKGCLRITVGTPEENRKLVEVLSKL